MTWLYEHHTYQTYAAIYCNTNLNEADMNTKANEEQTLQNNTFVHDRYKSYPPKGSKHYEVLEIGKYNI